MYMIVCILKFKNIFTKMFLHLFYWFLLGVATRINLLTLVQSSTSLAYL